MLRGFRKNSGVPKAKKTRGQVKADLVKSVCEQANASLSEPIVLQKTPTLDDLQEIFASLAMKKFNDGFGYPYEGERSVPPDWTPDFEDVFARTAFCSIYDDQDKLHESKSLVKEKLLRTGSLPDWALENARDDLVEQCSNLTKLSSFNDSWSSADFLKTYNRDNKEEKYLNSVRTSAVFIFVNASSEEEDVKVSINALYYIGVYYETLSVAKRERHSLFKLVCERASNLVKGTNLPSSPLTAEDLQMILCAYRDQQFIKSFGFDYDSTFPKDLDGRIYRMSHLLAYMDDDLSFLENDVKKITSSLPSWIHQETRETFLPVLTACINTGPYEDGYSWDSKKIDHTFFGKPGKPSVAQKSGVVWCNAFSVERRDVSYRYVFYFGVFYETAPGETVVLDDLVRVLCDSGKRLFAQPQEIPAHPTQDDLKGILLTACDDRFLQSFKFPFKGSKTKPIDVEHGSSVYACKISFSSSRVEADSAAQFVDIIMGTLNLPKWPNENTLLRTLRDDLTRKVQYCLALETANEFCVSSPFNTQYDYSRSTEHALATNGLFLYTNASLSAPSQSTVTASLHIIHYIGVYYNVPTGGGRW